MKTCIDCNKQRKPHMFAADSLTCHDCVAVQISRIATPRISFKALPTKARSTEGRRDEAFFRAMRLRAEGIPEEHL